MTEVLSPWFRSYTSLPPGGGPDEEVVPQVANAGRPGEGDAGARQGAGRRRAGEGGLAGGRRRVGVVGELPAGGEAACRAGRRRVPPPAGRLFTVTEVLSPW